MSGWKIGLGVGVGVGVPLFLLAAWPAFWYIQVRNLEKPKYRVVRKLVGSGNASGGWGEYGCELRWYDPYLVAEVEVEEGSMKKAMNSGFRQVAGFIFGKNAPPGAVMTGASGKGESVSMTSPVVVHLPEAPGKEKMFGGGGDSISMTSPVISEQLKDGTYRVAFMMPSKYDEKTLPVPLNDRVKIREVPAVLLASIGFSGNLPNEERVAHYRQKLEKVLKEEGLKVTGPATLLQYYPPFAPGFIRLNEVVVPIEPPSEKTGHAS